MAELEEAKESIERWRRKCVQVEAEVRALRVKLKELQFSKSGDDDARQIAQSLEMTRAEDAEKSALAERRARAQHERDKNDLEATIRSLADKLEKHESLARMQQQNVASSKHLYEKELAHERELREIACMKGADEISQYDRILWKRALVEADQRRKKSQLHNMALLKLQEELNRDQKALESKCVDLAACEEKLHSLEMEIADERRKNKDAMELTRRTKEQLQKERDAAQGPSEGASKYRKLQWELQRAEDTVRRLEENQLRTQEDQKEMDMLRLHNAEIREQLLFIQERNAFLEKSLQDKSSEEMQSLFDDERLKLKAIAKQALEKNRVAQIEVLELRRQLESLDIEKSPTRRSTAAKAQARLRGKPNVDSKSMNVVHARRVDEWANESERIAASVKDLCKNLKREIQRKSARSSSIITDLDRLYALVEAMLELVANVEDSRKPPQEGDGPCTSRTVLSHDGVASQMDITRENGHEDEDRPVETHVLSPTIARELSLKLDRKGRDLDALSASLAKMQQVRGSVMVELEGLVQRKEEEVRMYLSEMKEREGAFEYERTCLRQQLHEMERDLRQKNDDLKSMSIVVEAQRHHLEENCVEPDLVSLDSRHNTDEWHQNTGELNLQPRCNTGEWDLQRKEDAHAVKPVEHSRPYGSAPSHPRHVHGNHPMEERLTSRARTLTGRWPVRLGLIAPTPFGQRDDPHSQSAHPAHSPRCADPMYAETRVLYADTRKDTCNPTGKGSESKDPTRGSVHSSHTHDLRMYKKGATSISNGNFRRHMPEEEPTVSILQPMPIPTDASLTPPDTPLNRSISSPLFHK